MRGCRRRDTKERRERVGAEQEKGPYDEVVEARDCCNCGKHIGRTSLSATGAKLLHPLHLTLVGRRFTRGDEHLELQRLIAVGLQLHLVPAALE